MPEANTNETKKKDWPIELCPDEIAGKIDGLYFIDDTPEADTAHQARAFLLEQCAGGLNVEVYTQVDCPRYKRKGRVFDFVYARGWHLVNRTGVYWVGILPSRVCSGNKHYYINEDGLCRACDLEEPNLLRQEHNKAVVKHDID